MSGRAGRTGGRGFSLIELLVVVSIISLLSAILLPSLAKARRYSKAASCLSNFRQIAMGMQSYSQSYQGWLPAGPADQLLYVNVDSSEASPEYSDEKREGGGWRAVLYTPWQWGGRRARWNYLEDASGSPRTESLPRPLTRQIYASATLDSHTPIFNCPADDGLEYGGRVHAGAWDSAGLGRRPIYETLGNSYFVHLRGGGDFGEEAVRNVKKRTGQIVLAYEGILHYDNKYQQQPSPWPTADAPIRQRGWHGIDRGYNLLFLDGHAEFRQFRKLSPEVVRSQACVFVYYQNVIDAYR